MRIEELYTITTKTSVIFPHYNESGQLMSMILEGDQILFAGSKPADIINYNLRRAGSNLEGAAHSAKEILGGAFRTPVVISRLHGLSMTPTASPKSPGCIWLAARQVDTYVRNPDGTVKVVLRNGSIAELPRSSCRFKGRARRACTLQYAIEKNGRQVAKVKEDCTQSYVLRKPEKGLNCEEE